MKAVTVDTTIGGVQIAAAGNRDFINIYNNSGQTLFISYDGDSAALTVNTGWPIPAGQYFALSNDANRNVYNKEVRGIVAGGTADVRVQGA